MKNDLIFELDFDASVFSHFFVTKSSRFFAKSENTKIFIFRTYNVPKSAFPESPTKCQKNHKKFIVPSAFLKIPKFFTSAKIAIKSSWFFIKFRKIRNFRKSRKFSWNLLKNDQISWILTKFPKKWKSRKIAKIWIKFDQK